jgi:hypothetical protein
MALTTVTNPLPNYGPAVLVVGTCDTLKAGLPTWKFGSKTADSGPLKNCRLMLLQQPMRQSIWPWHWVPHILPHVLSLQSQVKFEGIVITGSPFGRVALSRIQLYMEGLRTSAVELGLELVWVGKPDTVLGRIGGAPWEAVVMKA